MNIIQTTNGRIKITKLFIKMVFLIFRILKFKSSIVKQKLYAIDEDKLAYYNNL